MEVHWARDFGSGSAKLQADVAELSVEKLVLVPARQPKGKRPLPARQGRKVKNAGAPITWAKMRTLQT
jgi:hypothetical protein